VTERGGQLERDFPSSSDLELFIGNSYASGEFNHFAHVNCCCFLQQIITATQICWGIRFLSVWCVECGGNVWDVDSGVTHTGVGVCVCVCVWWGIHESVNMLIACLAFIEQMNIMSMFYYVGVCTVCITSLQFWIYMSDEWS